MECFSIFLLNCTCFLNVNSWNFYSSIVCNFTTFCIFARSHRMDSFGYCFFYNINWVEVSSYFFFKISSIITCTTKFLDLPRLCHFYIWKFQYDNKQQLILSTALSLLELRIFGMAQIWHHKHEIIFWFIFLLHISVDLLLIDSWSTQNVNKPEPITMHSRNLWLFLPKFSYVFSWSLNDLFWPSMNFLDQKRLITNQKDVENYQLR